MEFIIGVLLIVIALSIILGLSIYSLIQVMFLGRKRFLLTPILGAKREKGADAVLSGADLSRDMTVTQATMTGVGAMIGAGIFVLTGIAAGIAGPGLLVAFAFNGVVASLIALVYAELGSAIPEAGGGYVWARAGLGELNGFYSGWMSWFAAAVAGSLYSLGFSAYFVEFLVNLGLNFSKTESFILQKLIAVIAIFIFLIINQSGSAVMGKAETWISGIKVLILAFFILIGFTIIFSNPQTSMSNFEDFFPTKEGFFSIFLAMGFTFIAFEGYEVVCQTGEEIYDPKVNIPKSVIFSILIVVPIYILVGIVALGAFTVEGQSTWQFLGENQELGLLYAAEKMLPGLGLVVILFGGIFSTLSALNAAIYSSTRVAFALGRDGSLPKILGSVSPKNHTPKVSIGVTGFIIMFIAVIIPINIVAASADLIYMVLFFQVVIAAIIIRNKMRKSKVGKLDYGYKTPLFPLVPLMGGIILIVIFSFTILLHPEALVTTILWLLLGSIVYILYARDRKPIEAISKLERHALPRADYIPEEFFTTYLHKILVPVRGIREIEWDAIRIAIFIAHEFGNEITIYHYGNQPEEVFKPYCEELDRLKIRHECKIVRPPTKKLSDNDLIQHLIDIASTGEYQLAVVPTRIKRRFWQKSTSFHALRKMPIPGLQVIANKKPSTTNLLFRKVGVLTPGSKRDPFLLQLGIAVVSSIRMSELIAYHWTRVPNLITPKVMAEAPGVQKDIATFLSHIGEALRMGVPIEQRHVLGHDFIRSVEQVVNKDQLDLLLMGFGKPRLGRKPSDLLAKKINCTIVIFHGRPYFVKD
ncbi:APC family permease [Candidatus Hodarchaeum mangrovi]